MTAPAGPSAPPRLRPTPGEVLFARYAYPPNQLGYCGIGDGQELLELAAGGVGGGPAGEDGGDTHADRTGTDPAEADMVARARRFDGAWPYLEIIAASSGIGDPLDRRVVEAYWVGNELLDAVDPAAFARAARHSFAAQSGADWQCVDAGHPVPAVPHHSFHVLAIYPWMALLRKGRLAPALTVIDRCRIRWGQVTARHDDHVDVSVASLGWDGHQLSLGEARTETARWAESGRSLSAPPEPGEWVSLHWDWVCDRLAPAPLDALRRFTARQLVLTNRGDAGGPG
jgi:hypothetical protein